MDEVEVILVEPEDLMEKPLFSLHVSRDGQGMLHYRTELHCSSHEFDFAMDKLSALCSAAAAIVWSKENGENEQGT